MLTIDEGLVERTWEAVRAYAPEEAKREAAAFLDRQPHVVTFVRAFGEEFPESVRGLALGVVYFLFKVLEADREEPLGTVPGVKSDPISLDIVLTKWMMVAKEVGHGPKAIEADTDGQ